jgi:hypothetical protein
MKASLALMALMLMSFSAQAAFVACDYQPQTCNEKGDMYLCTYYGWANGEFCSPKDVSRRPGFKCDECQDMPRPSEQCRTQCGCTSAFCGSW